MNLKNLKNLFGNNKNKEVEDRRLEASIELKKLSRERPEKRDARWEAKFLENLGEAHLACLLPQIQQKKDGFKYFSMEIPDIGAPFQSYVVSEMIESHLLKDGLGVSVQSYHDDPDVLISYGEILNYHYRKTFRSSIKNWIAPTPNQFNEHGEILGGNPSDLIIHPLARKVILAYLVTHNVHFPKVSLLNIMTDNGIMNQLVFNLVPEMFQSNEHFHATLGRLSWYLPKHYTYSSIPEHYLGDLFFDL